MGSRASFIFRGILAGIFGACAASTGTVAGTVDAYLPVELDSYIVLGIRVVLYGVMLLLNGHMLSNYMKSLEGLPSLQATVLSNASNIFCTGMIGHFFFSAHINRMWVVGVACILTGVTLISKASKTEDEKDKAKGE